MPSRLDLQTKFEELLGCRNVYFQPPASVKIKYPAIVYSRSAINVDFANNVVYRHSSSYEAILIDKSPDSEFVEKMIRLPYCRFERYYAADNLHHFVFTIHNT